MTGPAAMIEPEAPARSSFRPAADRAVVAALTLLALALRLPNIGRAYWIDEAVTIGISSHRVGLIPSLLRQDGSPPLFYFILHFWLEWFGSSMVATHTLPLLLSLAAVPAGYWAGRELFDRTAGLAAAALMATSPFLAWYSTETRMYTLVVLLSTVGTTLAWRAVRDRRRADACGAVLVGAALLYTHAWCIYLVAATLALLLWHAYRQADRRLLLAVAVGGAATFALWLPWLPSFVAQAGNSAAPWAVQPGIGDFFADPSTVLGGTIGFVVVPLLAAGVVLTRRRVSGPRRAATALIGATALLTTIAGFAGAEIQPSWTVRYLAVIAGPYLIAAAGYLSATSAGRKVIAAVCGLLTVWSVIGSLIPNPNNRYAKDNMAAVARSVSPMLAPGDAVIVTETEQVPVAHLYLPAGLQYLNPMGPVADPSVVDWRYIVERLDAASPCSALSAELDAMPVGARVLEIDPYKKLGAAGSAWSKAVAKQIQADDSFLAGDPALTELGVYAAGLSPRPFSPVYGVLWQKTAAKPACS